MPIRLRTAPSSGPLAALLASEAAPTDLVLVGSQLMERETRRVLQAALGGPAPDVRTLAAWLDEQAWLQADDRLPAVVVAPRERPLLIEEWVRTAGSAWESTWGHPDMVRALSDIVALGARAGVAMADLDPDAEPVRVLREFERWFSEQGFRWREALPGQPFTPEPAWHAWPTVWIHQIDHLFPTQWAAMDRLLRFWEATGIRVEILLCDTGLPYVRHTMERWGVPAEPVPGTTPAPEPVFLKAPNPVAEVEAVFTAILDAMDADPGAQLTDFRVLVGDLATYRADIEAVADEWDIPIRITQGAPFRSHPVAARWLRLFAWRQRGYRIDDAYGIFADRALKPPGDFPDLRALLRVARDINEPLLGRFRPHGKRESDLAYQETQHQRLIAIRDLLPPAADAPIPEWCRRTTEFMARFDLRANETVRTVTRRLEDILKGLGDTYTRLGLTRSVDEPTWLRTLDTWLAGFSQRPDDRPDALLVTEIHHLPEVHGKTVFTLGMAEGVYPRFRENPVLRRFGSGWRKPLDAAEPDPLDEARHHLARLAASAGAWRLSRPARMGSGERAPGLLWTEYAAPHAQAGLPAWPPRPSGAGWKPAPEPAVAARIGAMERARRNPDARAAGHYEGRLTPPAAARAWALLATPKLALSYSRLDKLAASRLDFLFRHVLRLDPGKRFQEDADHRLKGTVLHACLFELFSRGTQVSVPDLVDEVMAEYGSALGHEDGPFRSILRHQLIRMVAHEAKQDLGGYTPVWLEHTFEFEDELPADPPIPVQVSGIVDRMDADGTLANIWDYKSSGYKLPTTRNVEAGKSFQVPIYKAAARQAGFEPKHAGYLVLPLQKGPAGREVKILDTDVDWKTHATPLVDAIRAGDYGLPPKEPLWGEDFRPIRRLDPTVMTARNAGAPDAD